MSADGLKVELRDRTLFLTLAGAGTHGLTPAARNALAGALRRPDAGLKGIVLTAEGSGLALSGTGRAEDAAPGLGELCALLTASPVPVVALLQGSVTGPMAELSLAARARLATPSARIAFDDIALGLCPAGGSTLRLPMLIGAEAALRLLLSGRPVPASEALSLGLVDGITESASLAAASRLAEALSVKDILQRQEPEATSWQAAVTQARKGPRAQRTAGRKIVECVETALLLPAEAALAFEAAARAELERTPESAGLVAAARAERRALAQPPVLAQVQPLLVDRIGLLGGAADLARLAVAALSRDLAVTWVFDDDGQRQRGLAAVEAGIAEGESSGQLGPDRAHRMRSRILATVNLADLASIPFLITDQSIADPGGYLGTARLVLGGAEGEPGLALGQAGRVCELTLPPETLPLARATALAGLKRMGLAPLIVRGRPVLGERMADAGRTALAWMVARGVPRRLIGSALKQALGLPLPDAVSVEVPQVLRAMHASEVIDRWLAALANEGARLIDEGIARRPSDIDYLMVAGYRFPRWQGGPMHQADRRGLVELRRDLRVWGAEAALWSPAPLIDRLILEGRSFAALDD